MNNFSVIKKSSPFKEWLRYHFLDKKLKTGLGYIIFGLLAVGIASGTALIDVKVGIGILGAFAVILLLLYFFDILISDYILLLLLLRCHPSSKDYQAISISLTPALRMDYSICSF